MSKRNPIIKRIYQVLLTNGFENAYILTVTKDTNIISVTIQIPPTKELADLQSLMPNLKQELNAHDIKLGRVQGKKVEILFGINPLSYIPFNPSFIHPNTLKIELPSAFGSCFLDFADGASCHLLNGGTTRMGKTAFLLYLSTVLYLQTKGEIKLYITSTKLKDFYSFAHCMNCSLSRTDLELLSELDDLITEYKYRDSLLYSPAFAKATDAKSIKEFYPDQYHLFKPIFLLIDEYARFSDNREIQKKVMELVETAGYVNIHVIIATQRPDARTVLPPRIKGNLLARICFTTADKNNSVVILDTEGAENLGKIPGRAIFLDSETNIIQVPYITTPECEELLKPYKKEIEPHEPNTNEETKRSNDTELTNKIQNLFQESTSPFSVQEQQSADQCLQQNNETFSNGWFRLASTQGKR